MAGISYPRTSDDHKQIRDLFPSNSWEVAMTRSVTPTFLPIPRSEEGVTHG